MYQANLQVPRKDLINQTEYRIRTKAYGNIVIIPKENVLFNPESLTCPQPISSLNDQMNDDGQIDSSASHQSRKLQASDYYYVPDAGSNEDYSGSSLSNMYTNALSKDYKRFVVELI